MLQRILCPLSPDSFAHNFNNLLFGLAGNCAKREALSWKQLSKRLLVIEVIVSKASK